MRITVNGRVYLATTETELLALVAWLATSRQRTA
jgi:hypothetical protein